jgi:hypothetical protein
LKRARLDNVPALAAHGEIGRGRSRGANGNSKRGTNSASYLVARLKRDHPEIAAMLAAGGFRSVRAAAIAAGLVAAPTALDDLRRMWRRASPEEQAAFLAEATESEDAP